MTYDLLIYYVTTYDIITYDIIAYDVMTYDVISNQKLIWKSCLQHPKKTFQDLVSHFGFCLCGVAVYEVLQSVQRSSWCCVAVGVALLIAVLQLL